MENKRRRPSTLQLYLLDIGKLSPGDIILSCEKTLRSKGIRAVTGGTFSHAALYVGGGSYIHADGKGVHSANIQRWLFKSPDNVCILRTSEPKTAEIACRHARVKVGTKYSVPEAVRTKLGSKASIKQINRQFCSRLVAQAYVSASLQIVVNPDYCTPNDIFQSAHASMVPGCVRLAREPEVLFAKSDNPLEVKTEVTNKILDQVRMLVHKDIQTFAQMTEHVSEHPEHDEAICEIIRKSGYMDLWKTDTLKNPWRYRGDIFLALPLDCGDKNMRATMEIAYANKDKQRYVEMCQFYMQRRKQGIKLFGLMVELYFTLIQLCNARIAAGEHVLRSA